MTRSWRCWTPSLLCVRTGHLPSTDRADPELLAAYEHEQFTYAEAADVAAGEYPSDGANAAVVRSYLALYLLSLVRSLR